MRHVLIRTLERFQASNFQASDFWSSPYRRTDGQTDRQTESDAYEPTVQNVQVGSKIPILLTSVMSDTWSLKPSCPGSPSEFILPIDKNSSSFMKCRNDFLRKPRTDLVTSSIWQQLGSALHHPSWKLNQFLVTVTKVHGLILSVQAFLWLGFKGYMTLFKT